MEKTTIQIESTTLQRLRNLKLSERQSYDEVVNKLIDTVKQESLSDEELEEIQKGLEDVRRGRVHSIESVARELGINLK